MNFDGQLFDFISQETGLHHLQYDFTFVEFNIHFEDVDKRRASVAIGQHLVDGRRRLHFPHSGGLLPKNELIQWPTQLVCANPLKNVSNTDFFLVYEH
jgi:hypothetical protein